MASQLGDGNGTSCSCVAGRRSCSASIDCLCCCFFALQSNMRARLARRRDVTMLELLVRMYSHQVPLLCSALTRLCTLNTLSFRISWQSSKHMMLRTQTSCCRSCQRCVPVCCLHAPRGRKRRCARRWLTSYCMVITSSRVTWSGSCLPSVPGNLHVHENCACSPRERI